MSMYLLDAAFNLVNDYPGGAASLSPRMTVRDKLTGQEIKKSASTLAHEVRAQGTAKLGWLDLVKMVDLANDDGPLLAWARHRRLGVYPLPEGFDPDSGTGQNLAQLLTSLSALVASITMAESDGIITANELTDAHRKFGELSAIGLEMLKGMQRKHEAGLPAGVAAIAFPSMPVDQGGAA
ncbi:MAG: hypothetical protein JWP29_4396 [Rhodoferax sp.]|nr:hypothetical protein [Rhodoferax sp.]